MPLTPTASTTSMWPASSPRRNRRPQRQGRGAASASACGGNSPCEAALAPGPFAQERSSLPQLFQRVRGLQGPHGGRRPGPSSLEESRTVPRALVLHAQKLPQQRPGRAPGRLQSGGLGAVPGPLSSLRGKELKASSCYLRPFLPYERFSIAASTAL